MPKEKRDQSAVTTAATTQLTLINFDDFESAETESVESEKPVELAPAVPPETEETVLSTLEQFDAAFATDPLKDEYKKFGDEAHETVNPAALAPKYVALAVMIHNLMAREFNIAPNGYDRAAVIKKCETALRLSGVPESMLRPQEIVSYLWVIKLDRSTPGQEGEPRTFATDETPSDWFAGNVKLTALRVLARCISRVSRNDELDVWEPKSGFESPMRDWIKRLREGYLSYRQVEKLIEHRKKTLANERKAEKYAGLTADEIASVEAAEKNASLQAKLNSLGAKAIELQKMAAEELQKSSADLRDFLVNRQIIPPINFPTVEEIAARLTPGDAKLLVHELVRLYPTRSDRLNVFKALYATTKAVVAQLQSAQEKAKKAG